MSRINSSIVILLTPSTDCVGNSSTEDYPDYEKIVIEEPESCVSGDDVLYDLSERALVAAGRSDKVVVRCCSAVWSQQESLVQRLIAGGICSENITVIRFAMDQGNELHRLSFYRTKYCMWHPPGTVPKSVLA